MINNYEKCNGNFRFLSFTAYQTLSFLKINHVKNTWS